jgi:hypothetical protein
MYAGIERAFQFLQYICSNKNTMPRDVPVSCLKTSILNYSARRLGQAEGHDNSQNLFGVDFLK